MDVSLVAKMSGQLVRCGNEQRASGIQFGDVIEPDEALDSRIGHPGGIQSGDSVLFRNSENAVPILIGLRTSRGEPVLLPVDLVKRRPRTQVDLI